MQTGAPPAVGPCVLAIGGIDPSGGAGLAADARAIQSSGGFARLVPTCLTVQTSRAFVRAEAVRVETMLAMLDAAWSEGAVGAIKVGLCSEPWLAEALALWLRTRNVGRVPIVLDPVLGATAGGFAPPPRLVQAIRELLVPLAAVVTPNLPELAELAGAGGVVALLARGANAVVVKGGHGSGPECVDRLFDALGEHCVRNPRLDVGPVRGTGCAFAAALATALAHGAALRTALGHASALVHASLQATRRSTDGSAVPLAVAPLTIPLREL